MVPKHSPTYSMPVATGASANYLKICFIGILSEMCLRRNSNNFEYSISNAHLDRYNPETETDLNRCFHSPGKSPTVYTYTVSLVELWNKAYDDSLKRVPTLSLDVVKRHIPPSISDHAKIIFSTMGKIHSDVTYFHKVYISISLEREKKKEKMSDERGSVSALNSAKRSTHRYWLGSDTRSTSLFRSAMVGVFLDSAK